MCVSVCGENLKYSATELQDRDVERSSTKVEHGNLHVLICLVNTIGKGSGSRLVDYTLDVKACNLTCFLGSLTLRVGEVCRNCYDCIRHLLSEIILCCLLHFLKHHCGNLLRGVFATVNVNAWIPSLVDNAEWHSLSFFLALGVCLTHETLDRVNGILWVGDGLTFCRVAHLALTVLYKTYDRRGGALTLAVGYYNRLVAFKHGNAAVCRSQVNSNNLSHFLICFYCYYSVVVIRGFNATICTYTKDVPKWWLSRLELT